MTAALLRRGRSLLAALGERLGRAWGGCREAVAAWREARAAERGRRPYTAAEAAFLPAALEVLETPPSPVTRILALVIGLIFLSGFGWACIATLDTIAAAQGRIIPGGHTKVIQPLETAVVRAIPVQEGQFVEAGQPLVELDPTDAQADVDRLSRDLARAEADRLRLAASAAGGERLDPAELPDPALYRLETNLLAADRRKLAAAVAVVDGQIAELDAQRASARAKIDKLNETIPLVAEQVNARNYLMQQQVGARFNYLTTKQQLIDLERDRTLEQKKLDEQAATIDTLRRRIADISAEAAGKTQDELAQTARQIDSLAAELAKARQRLANRRLVAPVSGVIGQLAVHTVGAVVTPAQTLMVLVPDGAVLELEASIPNKDIGFIQAGQDADVKIDAFPFTRYGSIPGTVTVVSADAAPDPHGGPPQYLARVALARDHLVVGDRQVRLAPGMTATVEVKTGQRRVIGFFLGNFLKYQSESLRER